MKFVLAGLLLFLVQESKDDTFAILHAPGTKWVKAAAFDKQPGIADHVKYYKDLEEKGAVQMGGPFTDGTGGLMILRAASLEDAKKIAAADPAVKSGLLKADVHAWKIVIRERPKSLDPADPACNRKAPDTFKVKFETSAGKFTVKVVREWAPLGADRFFNLALNGYFDGCRFFRVIPGFMAQFGIHGKPEVSKVWRDSKIEDDPVVKSNTRGFVSFATAGPGTRTTQMFINYSDNSRLDEMGFSPFGEVVEGMDVVDKLYGKYGDGAPSGNGPDQGRIQSDGNAYLDEDFSKLDHVKSTKVVD